MQTEETKDKGKKENSSGFCCSPMGQGMSEMMKKCCAGRGGFSGCPTEMEGMMEEMKKQCCMPHKDADESERKKE
jgi:hypothetical protein